jgi:hypothetical protein
MAGRSISAWADEETARLVESVVKVEDRSAAQVAAAALRFYVQLPEEARAAIRRIEALGSAEEIRWAISEVARALLIAQFKIASRRGAEQMRLESEETLETDEDALDEAVRLTRRTKAAARNDA